MYIKYTLKILVLCIEILTNPYEAYGLVDPYPFTKGQNEKIVKLLGHPTILLVHVAVPCCIDS